MIGAGREKAGRVHVAAECPGVMLPPGWGIWNVVLTASIARRARVAHPSAWINWIGLNRGKCFRLGREAARRDEETGGGGGRDHGRMQPAKVAHRCRREVGRRRAGDDVFAAVLGGDEIGGALTGDKVTQRAGQPGFAHAGRAAAAEWLSIHSASPSLTSPS
jgi:hypothetical protein